MEFKELDLVQVIQNGNQSSSNLITPTSSGKTSMQRAGSMPSPQVSIPAQEPDQDDISYINSIDTKQLKDIRKFSDKNTIKELKVQAKKAISERIKYKKKSK